MSVNYKLHKNFFGELVAIIRTDDTTNIVYNIPFCEGNSDYDEYLKWVAEGNTADPAD